MVWKKIGFGAFMNCILLNRVIIPSTVITISSRAFENCYGLTNISIPDSVMYIGDDAFRNTSIGKTYVASNCVVCGGNYYIYNKK